MSVATGSVQATMQLSAVIVEKIKHKHSQKESNFPLPSLTSALPPCSRPLEFIQPLATRAEAWQAIPGVSEWVMGIIKRGYSLQFARRPLRFSGVVSTSVQGENVHVLHSEVMTLLEKGAIEMVPRYFLVPKKDGGLRPILDLRCLNHALMRRPFRMITLKQILSQIRTDDMSVVSYINHQGLPERVLNTISEARAPSMRRLYALKWSVFSTWCLNRGENPSTSELAVVLSFLQELLDKAPYSFYFIICSLFHSHLYLYIYSLVLCFIVFIAYVFLLFFLSYYYYYFIFFALSIERTCPVLHFTTDYTLYDCVCDK